MDKIAVSTPPSKYVFWNATESTQSAKTVKNGNKKANQNLFLEWVSIELKNANEKNQRMELYFSFHQIFSKMRKNFFFIR